MTMTTNTASALVRDDVQKKFLIELFGMEHPVVVEVPFNVAREEWDGDLREVLERNLNRVTQIARAKYAAGKFSELAGRHVVELTWGDLSTRSA
jgi:hypothetical protein